MLSFNKYIVFLCFLLFNTYNSFSQQNSTWSKWEYLLGNWVGEGTGHGKSNGSFSFQYDLDKKILVRKNHTVLAATKENPEIIHDDLMIVYPGEDYKAVYFDNEGHVINYSIIFTEKDSSIVFTSEPKENLPTFRLTYSPIDKTHIQISFDMAPPGKTDVFTNYLTGTAKKTK